MPCRYYATYALHAADDGFRHDYVMRLLAALRRCRFRFITLPPIDAAD